MVFGYLGTKPQTVAHHIGFRNGLKRFGGTDEHIATDNHGGQTVGGGLHDLLIEGHLYVEQVLRQPLSAFPTKHGDGGENLS